MQRNPPNLDNSARPCRRSRFIPRLRLSSDGPLLLGVCLWLTGVWSGGHAATVRRLDLNGLCERADRIVRGVVVDANPGSVEAGGGRIPTVTYRIKVKEVLHGAYASQIELTVVSAGKEPVTAGQARRLPLFQELPQFEKGREYLLFTTAPSRLGLSTTVGLSQGSFAITAQDKKDYAVNGLNNAGLGLPATGPVAYEELAQRIRARINR